MFTRRDVVGLMCQSLATCGPASAIAVPTASRFRRGVNFHRPLNWPRKSSNGYAYPAMTSALKKLPVEALAQLRHVGIDFVRLTVNPGVFVEADGADLAQITSVLRQCIERILNAGHDLIIDTHPVSQDKLFAKDSVIGPTGKAAPSPDWIKTLTVFARTLSNYPKNRIALELWNEPNISPMRREDWLKCQRMAYQSVREVDSELAVIITGIYCKPHELIKLNTDAYHDRNLLYTFHFYEPMAFTHQNFEAAGSNNNPERFFENVTFPMSEDAARKVADNAVQRATAASWKGHALDGRQQDKLTMMGDTLVQSSTGTQIARTFDTVSNWASWNGISPSQILLGEFGVMRPNVDPQSRLRWISFIRSQAERCGFGWCRWSFDIATSFGMTVSDSSLALVPGELQALGLKNDWHVQ